ncbi:MAG: hypothetical protein QOH96_169 [Blastocatellia bacterium]|jgi:hypothetical protein|nr:hypothetical protein [Blastocatellia bacterium]
MNYQIVCADYKSETMVMSKQIRTQLFGVSVIGLFLFTIAIGPVVDARQEKGIAAGATAASRSAAVVAATQEVLKETSEVRQLSILRPVKSGTHSREEIARYVRANLDEENSPERVHASETTLKTLGLVPSNFDLRTFLVKLLTEQVAGYYDAKKQEFFLADWIDLDGQKPVMAHELTHALQDQHFNLRRFDKWPKGESDSELAYHSLVEGDATLTMTFYMTRDPVRAFSFLKSFSEAGAQSTKEIDGAPRALRESLLFPYQQGMQWAMDVHKLKGWEGVSNAFTELPQSSEQILHPEKYLAHEAPVKISLPDVSGDVGGKWKQIDYDVNGEWTYFLILDQYLRSEKESHRAAAGWGGDRYAVYEKTDGGGVLITQLSAWDSEQDAIEFFRAYLKRCNTKYQHAEGPAAEKDADTKQIISTNEGIVSIERRGNRVLIIEGLPDRGRLSAVSTKLWGKGERMTGEGGKGKG